MSWMLSAEPATGIRAGLSLYRHPIRLVYTRQSGSSSVSWISWAMIPRSFSTLS